MRGALVGAEEQEVDVGSRRQLLASVAADRHHRELLAGGGIRAAVELGMGEIQRPLDQRIHLPAQFTMHDLGAAAGLEIALDLAPSRLKLVPQLAQKPARVGRGAGGDLVPQSLRVDLVEVQRGCHLDKGLRAAGPQQRRRSAGSIARRGLPSGRAAPCQRDPRSYRSSNTWWCVTRAEAELDRLSGDGWVRGLCVVGVRYRRCPHGGSVRAEPARRTPARGRACRDPDARYVRGPTDSLRRCGPGATPSRRLRNPAR